MCLAIPAQIVELKDNNIAQVDIMGVSREIAVDLTPSVNVGEFVLVHAGFSIEIIDEQVANETIDIIRQFPELVGEDLAGRSAVEEALSLEGGASQAGEQASDVRE